MKTLRKWNVAAIAALGVVAMGTTAMAAAADIVKERQASMKAQGADMKAITDYARGKGDKDAALKGAGDWPIAPPRTPSCFPRAPVRRTCRG